jgi:PAS domain S-box-containing protein
MKRWLPRTLLGRIFALLAASVMLFTMAGLVFIHNHHFNQEVGDANETLELLSDAVVPTLSDSAVIGDYDTIKRTLDRLARSPAVSAARFTDSTGLAIAGTGEDSRAHAAPDWLVAQVAGRLKTSSREVSAGGKNYGALTLVFEAATIADDIWLMTRAYLVFALLLLAPGLYLVRIPLKRMVLSLARIAEFATQLKLHEQGSLHLAGAPVELEHLAHALNQVSHELTAQHQALAESAARKSAILAAGLDCFITIDDAGCIIDFNRAAEQTFGYRAEEAHGRLISELIIPPELRAAHEQGMARWHSTGDGPVLHQRIEISAMRRSGEIFPVELAIVPFGSGDRHFFAGFMRDITERRHLEAERERITQLLRQSVAELEYQKFALDQHAIVSISDAAGTIIYANEKYSEISGYSRTELLGSTHRIVSSGMQDAAFYRELWQTISDGRTWHGELANRNKHGEIFWVASTIVPWLDESGKPYQYVSIYTDITAQKMSEQALAEARRRELETGSEIQRSLLLGDLPGGIHGAYLATYTESSQGIDGDFFAITRFRPDCFELLVGDVMGKGVPAALIGAAVKSAYNKVLAELFSRRASEHQLPTPAEIINALHQNLTPRLIELSSFVTLALYRFDGEAGTLCFVNAGHTPGLLARKENNRVESIIGDNLPIGVLSEEVYLEKTLPVCSGDALLVYSDGITESSNGRREEFGPGRLAGILQAGHAAQLPPTSMLQSIRQQVREFVGSSVLIDDQTAVMVEIQPRRSGRRGGIDQRAAPSLMILPWRLDGLAPLRTEIAATATHLPAQDVDAIVLASFEAATNILRHAKPYFGDAVITCKLERRADELSVELIYPGPTFTPPADPMPDFSGASEGGFGLYIIENCVDSVEYASLLPGVSSIRLVKRRSAAVDAGPAA